MAAVLPTERTQQQVLSTLKAKKHKRKRDKRDEDLERLDSLTWNSSLPYQSDDPFSFFVSVGNGELDGGFLSLEEVDEADYGLALPQVEKRKLYKSLKSKKQKHNGNNENAEEQDESLIAGKNVEEKKINAKKKKKKRQKVKGTQKDTESATVCEEKGGQEEDIVDEADEAELYSEYSAWSELRLHPLLMKSIYRLGFKEPTPIQKASIPAAAHQGKDVVGAAETGSGKTLAFGLPILQRLLEEGEKVANLIEREGEEAQKYAPKGVLRALIVTPTRELALQVTDHLREVAKGIDIRVVPIVGGMSAEKQERLLKARPEIIVGTPGRLWERMSEGETHLVELHSLSFFVLDEADRMVETGHFRELQSIIEMLPLTKANTEVVPQNSKSCVTVSSLAKKKRQTFVFSATIALSADFRKKLKCGSLRSKQSMDGLNSIEILSERAGMKPDAAIIDLTSASILAKKLEESFIECTEEDKDAYLYYLLRIHGLGRTIVFCTSIAALRHISALLGILGLTVSTLHSERQQRARLKAIDRVRSDAHGILVATDVAARGLDIAGVRTVIHYQLPHSAEVYVHRSGRTARASADGCSIALIAPNDSSKFASLCKSFSKESVKRFPLESSYMPEVRKRLSLARQIDKITRKDSQEKAKTSWFEQNAKSLELVIENDDSEEERVDEYRQKKATSMQLKKLQQELNLLLSQPLQPKTFSQRYPAAAGVSHVIQHQFEDYVKQKIVDNSNSGENRKSKLVVIGRDCMEPLQALRGAGHEVSMDLKEMADKRKHGENLRRKRKEAKKRLRDQRRKQRKKQKGKSE